MVFFWPALRTKERENSVLNLLYFLLSVSPLYWRKALLYRRKEKERYPLLLRTLGTVPRLKEQLGEGEKESDDAKLLSFPFSSPPIYRRSVGPKGAPRSIPIPTFQRRAAAAIAGEQKGRLNFTRRKK